MVTRLGPVRRVGDDQERKAELANFTRDHALQASNGLDHMGGLYLVRNCGRAA